MDSKDKNKKLWFKRKLYGWGWYPVSWEGWSVTIFYIGIIILLYTAVYNSNSTTEWALLFLLPVAILTSTFIRIAYKYGETPKWQWGKKREDN